MLFGSYVVDLAAHLRSRQGAELFSFEFSLNDPKVIIGLFIGGLLPYMFTAFSMDAVGKAAGAVVKEVRRQIAEARHSHGRRHAGIRHLRRHRDQGRAARDDHPGAAPGRRGRPRVAAIPRSGTVVLGGVLVGTIVTGLFVAHRDDLERRRLGQREEVHRGRQPRRQRLRRARRAVTGDTVGDPYKDTAGPAINPMIKVVNIVAILIIPIFF